MKIEHHQTPAVRSMVDGTGLHVGEIVLASDEQVTFCVPSGAEYDVASKEWGLYATPSLGSRLPRLGLRPALVRSKEGLHLMLVEIGRESDFESDMTAAGIGIQAWLDNGIDDLAQEHVR
jgi:hypothetical protein